MALTGKKRMFAERYMRHFNQTRAAIEAGYSKNSARTQGYDLLREPDISDYIRTRMSAVAMGTDEVLYHLREIAIGLRADVTDGDGKIDAAKVKKANKTHLVKSFHQRSVTTEQSDIFESDLEPYDRIKALELLGKHLGMFSTVKIEDWRTQAIADIRAGKIPYEALADAFSTDLAAELFAAAGVSVQIGQSAGGEEE